MHRLDDAGIHCLLFGGWAEEALGLCPARPHKDADLLLPARSFDILDHLIAASPNNLKEIALKRFAHKRAFVLDGLMVEMLLVQEDGGVAWTSFWGDVRFVWMLPLAEYCTLGGQQLLAASRDNLRRYRANHRSTEPWRWRDPASLAV